MVGVAVSDGSSMDKDLEDKDLEEKDLEEKHQWPLQLPAVAIVDEDKDKLQWKQMDNWSQLYRDLPLLLASIDTTRYSSGVEPLHEVGDHTIILSYPCCPLRSDGSIACSLCMIVCRHLAAVMSLSLSA